LGLYRGSTASAGNSFASWFGNLLGGGQQNTAAEENPLNYSGSGAGVGVTAVPGSAETSLPPLDKSQYVVQPGDTLNKIAEAYGTTAQDVRLMNGIIGDLIQVGQVLLIPVVPTATPEATPEPESSIGQDTAITAVPDTAVAQAASTPSPIDMANEIQALQSAKKAGDITGAETLISYILAQQPGNQVVVQMRGEIEQAQALRAAWDALGQKNGKWFVYASGESVQANGRMVQVVEYVPSILRGFNFEVMAVDSGFLRSSNLESLTVRCTSPGWMYGVEFEVQRLLAYELYGVKYVGETFYAG